jgi:protein tyrosine/serine phosphatase
MHEPHERLTGAYNFRDLGGLPTEDGRSTRYGRLFRSDTLQDLTEADVELLCSELGICRVVDLRSQSEISVEGLGLLQERGLAYHHVALTSRGTRTPAPAGGRLAQLYIDYLDAGADSLVTALDLLSGAGEQPTVFHCAAGKDRTGVVAALLLRLLGVTEAAVIADYARTQHSLERMMERLRRMPSQRDNVSALPAEYYLADERTMRTFLAGLQQRHGGARAWALAKGLPAAAIDRLERTLLEPAREISR